MLRAIFFTAISVSAATSAVSGAERTTASTVVHSGPTSAIVIDNRSSASVTGFHASYACPNGRADFFFDTAFNFEADVPIQPHTTFDFAIPSQIARCGGQVDAMVFSDGTSQGSAQAISTLFARRIAARDEMRRMRAVVLGAPSGSWDAKSILKALADRRASVSEAATMPSDERAVRQHIIDGLQIRVEAESSTTAATPAQHQSHLASRVGAWHQALIAAAAGPRR